MYSRNLSCTCICGRLADFPSYAHLTKNHLTKSGTKRLREYIKNSGGVRTMVQKRYMEIERIRDDYEAGFRAGDLVQISEK